MPPRSKQKPSFGRASPSASYPPVIDFKSSYPDQRRAIPSAYKYRSCKAVSGYRFSIRAIRLRVFSIGPNRWLPMTQCKLPEAFAANTGRAGRPARPILPPLSRRKCCPPARSLAVLDAITDQRSLSARLGTVLAEPGAGLLDHDAIAGAAAERLGHVHLLGFWRRHDEVAGRGRARHVRVVVDTFPQ